MELQTDDRGNQYIETDRPHNEKTRVTYVPYQEWAGQTVIRVQVREAGGNLRPGPEILSIKSGTSLRASSTY